MRRIFFSMLIIMVGVGVIHAQAAELDETFVSSDGTLSFSYASEWSVEEVNGSFRIESDEIVMGIFSSIDSPSDLPPSLEAYIEQFIADSPALTFDETSVITLESGRKALRTEFSVNDIPGFLLGLDEGDGYVLMLVSIEEVDGVLETIYAVADSIELDASAVNSTQQNEPTVLDMGDGLIYNWNDVVDVLSESGFISGEGELLLESEMSSTGLFGPYSVDDDSESTYANVAGGALLSFRPDSDENICGFTNRTISGEEELTQFLFIGVDALDNIVVFERISEGNDSNTTLLAEVPSETVFHNPNYLHYVLNDNQLTVFVNGVALIEGLEVSLPEPDRRGEVEPGTVGLVLEFSCVMTDAWIYGFESE